MSARRRLAGRVLAAVTAVAVLLLTLWPMPEEQRRSSLTPLWCLVCGDIGTQDVLQNVLMLLPFGLGLALAGVRARTAVVAGFALSFFVEMMQYGVVAGRDASLSDLVTNTAGTALGAWLAGRVDTLLRPARAQAAALARGALAAWLALWLVAAWLLGLSPGPAPWRVDVQPDIIDAPAFEGEVRAAAVSGVTLRHGLQDVPPMLRARYAADSLAVAMDLVTGPRTWSRRGLLEVRDAKGRVNAVVAQMGADARLSLRIRASDLLLRPIRFRDPGRFDVEPGTAVGLDLRREGGWMLAGGERTPIGPHWLTTLLLPVDAEPGAAWEAFAYLWVAALLALSAWWAARARLGVAEWAAGLALAGAALAAVPPLAGLAPTTAVGWALAAGAVALGGLAGRRRPSTS